MVTIKLNGSEYTLACTLRVAYELQNQHNHAAYSKILSEVGNMPLEQQLDFLYIAFRIANPEVAKTFTKEMFRLYILDNEEFNASVIVDMLKGVISGIMGKEIPNNAAEAEAAAAGDPEKN